MWFWISTPLIAFGIIKIAGAILAYRDRPQQMLVTALPGIGSLIAAWFIAHGLLWMTLLTGFAALFMASAITGAAYEIGYQIGRLYARPRGTLATVYCDGFFLSACIIIGGYHPFVFVMATLAGLAWILALVTWMVGGLSRSVTAPLRARRFAEADEQIARMEETDVRGGGV